ncbi:MAG: L,D-transpeptidase family protein [Bacteroidota bacterium]|nr:L,D-transpeptidase family protein [Bacteroidota bacterium]MDP3145000.1 L,D-transpeptidase family protein [Bacteroidota bacterium]
MKQILFISSLLFLVACKNGSNDTSQKIEVKIPQAVNLEIQKILTEIYSNSIGDTLLEINKDTLISYRFFDKLRDKKNILFSNKGKLTSFGDSLFFIIKNARFYGLYPNDYHYTKLEKLTKKFYNQKEDYYDAAALAEAEILFTDAYLKFGAHLNKGRFNPDTILIEWNPKKLDTNWVSILKMGIQQNNLNLAFDSLEPKHAGYHFLKKAIRSYINENEKLNWDTISFKNISDTLKFKEDLKQKLIASGDYNDSLNLNDSLKLASAVKSYQKKFNLEPDGKLGKLTRQTLALSKEQTIRQMEMALERWRWEPTKYPERYAIVNIPSAEINVYEWDKKHKIDTLVLNSKIVVGKPETQTPTLKSKINYMLIYPYWSVPYTIAWKEILPMVKRDTNYLHKHNFEVINWKGEVVHDLSTLNWKKFSKEYLPVKFRQRIGDENSLGICKFNFNNKYGVYLHDTNSKRYFKTFYRYQSHGCMRIEKFVDLARFLIRDDTIRLPYDTLNAYFAREEQKQINLRKPLPIYVRYFTANVDENQKLNLFIDIYRKDEEMMKLIYK